MQLIARRRLGKADAHFISHDWEVRFGNDRTVYVVGLWGAGRTYVKELIRQNIGRRSAYVREGLGPTRGPTSMIHSGHCTIKHVSRAHLPPVITRSLLQLVECGSADLIFVYRHPLDSLLTNWLCWRTMIRDNDVAFITHAYESSDDLCADVERHFTELEALARGDSDLLAPLPKGPRFMSLPEYVEETALFIEHATLALRLEDFKVDPVKEFSKIVDAISAEVDVSRLRVEPPRSRSYGYLEVKEKVPQFRKFVDGLDAETRGRIAQMGYAL